MSTWYGRNGASRALAGLLIVCACTPTRRQATCEEADEPVQVRAGESSGMPVITTLRTRDREVDVFASQQGLRFTVRDAEGSVLADRVDRSGFARAFPTLQHHFDTAFAGEMTWLDASAGVPVLPTRP